MNDFADRIIKAIEHRAEMGHYTIAAIIAVCALFGFIGVLAAIVVMTMKFFGTWAYVALVAIVAVLLVRSQLKSAFPQEEDEDETGVS